MSLLKNKRFNFGMVACLAIVASGCAGLDGQKWNLDQFGPQRAAITGDELDASPVAPGPTLARDKQNAKQRKQAAVSEFDARRNDAQFLAAETSWRQGDSKRSREALEKILARDPAHRGAVLLLADVHLEADRSAEAVEVLERGVAALPADAEVAYKLGVALEADGQSGESRHWLRQAATKEPANEKYRDALARAAAEEPATRGQSPDPKPSTKKPAGPSADAVAQLLATPKKADAGDTAPTPFVPSGRPAPAKSAAAGAPAHNDTVSPHKGLPSPNTDPSESFAPETASDAAFQAALADWDAGRKQACESKLLQLIVEDPQYVDAAILLAEVELDSGRGKEARARVERLVIRHPNDARVRRACGLTYEALGEKELAASCFAKADRLAVEPPAPTLTHRQATALHTAGGRAPQPAKLDLAVLEIPTPNAPSEPVASTAAGTSTGSSANLSSPSDEAAAKAAEAEPAGPGPAEPAPSILRFEGAAPPASFRPGTVATTRSTGAATGAASAAELLDRGTAALVEGNIDAAREAFSQAILTDSKNSQTAVTAAVAALKHAQPELALQLSTQGLKSLPRSAGLHRIHGTAAYQLGRLTEAEAALKQSLSLDNSQALSYFLLGSVQSRLGKNEAADGQFRQAARLDRRYAVRR